jgi:imidazole glycerol-phosphate synthase subunit HisH
MGNVASVAKAVRHLGHDPIVTAEATAIADADHIILPGVGAFAAGMGNLRSRGLEEILNREVIEKGKPFMGICLGMQLLATTGTEPDDTPGLGWIPGRQERILAEGLRIPHLGWNEVTVKGSKAFASLPSLDFYFIHSYHLLADDDRQVVATVPYGAPLTAAVQRDNVFATQFHPEKSQVAGLQLMRNVLEGNA